MDAMDFRIQGNAVTVFLSFGFKLYPPISNPRVGNLLLAVWSDFLKVTRGIASTWKHFPECERIYVSCWSPPAS